MSKYFYFAILILLLNLVLLPKISFAQSFCPVTTNPEVITDRTPSATFTIDVGNTADATRWRTQFQCTTTYGVNLPNIPMMPILNPANLPTAVNNTPRLDATVVDSKTISVRVDNDFLNSCIFDTNRQSTGILVQAIVRPTGGVETTVNRCVSSYAAKNHALVRKCTLSINPDQGIIFGQPIAVKAENLAENAAYTLFLDNNYLALLNTTLLGTESNTTIDYNINSQGEDGELSLITPGTHTISIRTDPGIPTRALNDWAPGLQNPFNTGGLINSTQEICSVKFSAGTLTNPGKVIQNENTGLPGKKKTLEIKFCENEQGIPTAIGCLSTEPTALINDLLKFILGIGGGVAFLLMVFGAIQMIGSAGNPETLQGGQEMFTNAIIGLLFVIFAVLLLQVIGVDILKIPGFS